MCTRFAVAVVTLASPVAGAATADESYLLDIESVVGARLRAMMPFLDAIQMTPEGPRKAAELAAGAKKS